MDEVEVTVESISLPAASELPDAQQRSARGAEPCYLFVHRQAATFADPGASEARDQADDMLTLQSSVLTPTGKATVVTDSQQIDKAALRKHLERIELTSFSQDTIESFGAELAEMLLPDSIKTVLKTVEESPLVVIHDAEGSRVPWETLCIDGWFPAARKGLSRKYAAENLSVAKWLENRRLAAQLNILLVINPTGDLPGAQAEGESRACADGCGTRN